MKRGERERAGRRADKRAKKQASADESRESGYPELNEGKGAKTAREILVMQRRHTSSRDHCNCMKKKSLSHSIYLPLLFFLS